jgi:hypothetical protein
VIVPRTVAALRAGGAILDDPPSGTRVAELRRMKLRTTLFVVVSVACATGCVSQPDYYVATSGTIVKADAEPADDLATAMRASGAHDLPCKEDAIATYQVNAGSNTVWTGRRLSSRHVKLQVAEGCGRRAVYSLDCDDDAPVPRARTEDPEAAARRARWAVDPETAMVCRPLLLSRVDIDAPRAAAN